MSIRHCNTCTCIDFEKRDSEVVIEWVYGASQSEIAAKWHISPQRVHQLVLRFLRKNLSLSDEYLGTLDRFRAPAKKAIEQNMERSK